MTPDTTKFEDVLEDIETESAHNAVYAITEHLFETLYTVQPEEDVRRRLMEECNILANIALAARGRLECIS